MYSEMTLDRLVPVDIFAKEKNIPIEIVISRIEEDIYYTLKPRP